jgi:DNA-binding FadR family transcriptional regulator
LRPGSILESVRTHVDRTRRLLLPEPGRMPATLKEHQEIYRTIADRDSAAAACTMRTHLDGMLREIEVFQEPPQLLYGLSDPITAGIAACAGRNP